MKVFESDFLADAVGLDVAQIAVRLVRAANREDETVCVDVNNIMLVARPGDSPQVVAQAWRDESSVRLRRWKQTPDYWRMELADKRAGIIAKQLSDEHLAMFASLNLNDIGAVITWLATLLSDGTDTGLRNVAVILELNGYKGYDSIAGFIEDSAESHGRWLIAQFITAVKQDEYAHMNTFAMSFSRLVQEWHERFTVPA